jgi:hypothetical protein
MIRARDRVLPLGVRDIALMQPETGPPVGAAAAASGTAQTSQHHHQCLCHSSAIAALSGGSTCASKYRAPLGSLRAAGSVAECTASCPGTRRHSQSIPHPEPPPLPTPPTTATTLIEHPTRHCRRAPGHARARLPAFPHSAAASQLHAETLDRGHLRSLLHPPPRCPPPCRGSRPSRRNTGPLRRALLHPRGRSWSRCRPSYGRPRPRPRTPPATATMRPRAAANVPMAAQLVRLLRGKMESRRCR